jgi:hypothetical protein
MFTLQIATDNAALGEPEGPADFYDFYEEQIVDGEEVARILRVIAARLDRGDRAGKAVDYNGNTVGRFDLNGMGS